MLNLRRRRKEGLPTWRQWYAIPVRGTEAPEWIEWLRKQKGGIEGDFFLREGAPQWIFDGVLMGGEGLQPVLSECRGVAVVRAAYRQHRDPAKRAQPYLGIAQMVLSFAQRAVDVVANVRAQRYYVADDEWFERLKRFELSDHFSAQSVNSGRDLFWVHSHGLVQFDLPEVEVREVPAHLEQLAGTFIRMMAEWMMSGERLAGGHTIEAPDNPGVWAVCESVRAADNEDHGEPDYPLLRFSDFDPETRQKSVGLDRFLSVLSSE